MDDAGGPSANELWDDHRYGDSRSEGKIVSLFEPSAEVIRKGKASKPTEVRQAG